MATELTEEVFPSNVLFAFILIILLVIVAAVLAKKLGLW
jgi:hypothetical protein